jgi:hypothetical protein
MTAAHASRHKPAAHRLPPHTAGRRPQARVTTCAMAGMASPASARTGEARLAAPLNHDARARTGPARPMLPLPAGAESVSETRPSPG